MANTLKAIKTTLPGVLRLSPQVFGDDRGYFQEAFNKQRFSDAIGVDFNPLQDNESKSKQNVIRGFAYQAWPYTQAKIVRVLQGEVMDVVLDMRKASPTFGQHQSFVLNSEEKEQLFIPRGFAHAFRVLSESATVLYKVDNYFHPESERGVIYNDSSLNINWGEGVKDALVSEKDLSRPMFKDAEYFEEKVKFYD